MYSTQIALLKLSYTPRREGKPQMNILRFTLFINPSGIVNIIFVYWFLNGVWLKVIRILEGDALLDMSRSSTPGHDMGSGSGKIYPDHHQNHRNEQPTGRLINKELEAFSRKLSLDTKRSVYRERDKTRRSSSEWRIKEYLQFWNLCVQSIIYLKALTDFSFLMFTFWKKN